MKNNFEKLEFDCYYKDGNNKVVGPIVSNDYSKTFPFADQCETYTKYGTCYFDKTNEYDLIEKVQITPYTMPTPEFKLEDGCRYFTRDARLVSVGYVDGMAGNYKFIGSNSFGYLTNGKAFANTESKYDLIIKFEPQEESKNTMNFSQALELIKIGKFVTRKEWTSGFKIKKNEEGKIELWNENQNGIINDGNCIDAVDVMADDWILSDNTIKKTKELKLFVGAICKLRNGKITTVVDYCEDNDEYSQYETCNSSFHENGMQFKGRKDDYDVVRILNRNHEINV